MLRQKRNVALACALSALAGYVDGIGFIYLGGLFVSFMSGNSTRLGVSLAEGNWASAAKALGLIATFVAGAAIGSLIVRDRGNQRQSWVLFVEAILLAAAAAADAQGYPEVTSAAMVLAMGLENSVFQGENGVGIGLTYMTGALVKAGQLLSVALTGGERWSWFPHLLLWASLVTGSVGGALAYAQLQLAAIWFAAGLAFVLALILSIARRRIPATD